MPAYIGRSPVKLNGITSVSQLGASFQPCPGRYPDLFNRNTAALPIFQATPGLGR
jgi:hypothetical protein